jgi:competence protein ComEA
MNKILNVLMIALALVAGTAVAHAAPKEPSSRAAKAALHGVVNLNQADEAALELLPGIGPAKSTRIIEFRKTKPFKKVEELSKVKGFGRKTLAKLKPYLAVSGQTTLTEEVAAAAK